MGLITDGITVERAFEIFFIAPLQNPNLGLSLLPVVLGALVMELYFGRFKSESLGWNTAVGNMVIWLTTGMVLFTAYAQTSGEKNAALGLILLGLVFGALDFFHKWPDSVAFLVSSSGVVYSLTYAATVLVRADLDIDGTSLKAAALFVVAFNVAFKAVETLEPSKGGRGIR